MMQKLYIKTTQGTKGSQSAKRLAQELTTRLGYKVWRSTKVFPKKQALSYGAGVDKITQYKWFEANGVPALEYTTSKEVATNWLLDNQTVIGRKLIQASCGKGIIILDGHTPETVDTNCPVYTLYKKKKREFRVHVFADKVVRVVEKKIRKGWNGPRDAKIRNLANGFVFCSCEDEPAGIRELAIKAAGVVASDFAGVDIGYNEKKGELFVIEVNSAPGMEGTNITAYANAILGK